MPTPVPAPAACADAYVKHVSCADDTAMCAKVYAHLMSPEPVCQNATGTCACPIPALAHCGPGYTMTSGACAACRYELPAE
jgi:hypothetical protein